MPPPANGLDAATRRDVAAFLDEQLAAWNVPGASLAVFDADGVIYETAMGARTLDPVEPATPASLFHVASVTKTFTAIALLQFVERGDLALDDPVADHVEFLEAVPGDPITVEELLTHTSGIPSAAGSPRGHVAGKDDLVRRIDREAEPRLTDRDRLSYLNSGYVVLGDLVAALAGRPYAEHVRDAVLEPMGMARSTFDPGAIQNDGNAMAGYVAGEGDEPEPTPMDPGEYPAIREGCYGLGGLVSTVRDLAALGPFILGDGTVGGEQVLSASTVASMTRPQSPPWPTVDGYDLHFGHGFTLEDLLGETLVYGGGSVPGWDTFVGVLPDRGVGVALGCNRSSIPKIDLGQGLLALVCGASPEEAVRRFRAERAIEAVRGTYELARSDTTARVASAEDGDPGAMATKLEVAIDDWDTTFRAVPDDGRPGEVAFSSRMGNGFVWTLEFTTADGEDVMVLSMDSRTFRFDAV